MPIPKRKTVLLTAILILLVETAVVVIFTRPTVLNRTALVLGDTPVTTANGKQNPPAKLLLAPGSSLIDLTLLVPHSPLRQTRYLLSIATPAHRHISLPSLFAPKAGQADSDTLRVTLDRNYFNGPSGNYTIVLNEIILENPGSRIPGVYLYPVVVASN